MELAIDDPIKRAQEYAVNPNNYQGSQAPLSNNPGLGTQMANMAKQQLMEKAVTQGTSALTGAGTTAGMGGSAMAGVGTAMPYVGAGLLAGKALGFFNEGGTVGPLSTQYAADGYQVPGSTEYNKRMDRNRVKIAQERPVEGLKNQDQATRNFNEGLRQLRKYQDFVYPMIIPEYGATMSPTTNMQRGVARMAYTDDPIAQKMYDVGNAPLDTSSSGMYANYIGLPIDSQGYTARGYDQGGQIDPINQILDEIEAEEASQMVEGAIGPSQAMQFPLARPVNLMQEDMPEGRDRTYSPYDMIRPDNAPNT
jgi:hypothetical protein